MTEQNQFTRRDLEVKTIESIEGGTIRFADGWCFGGVPADVLPRLEVGAEYLQETRNFSLVTGMATLAGEWLWHKTDADLDREREEMLARIEAENEEMLARNREDWERREALLPEPLKRRLERFRQAGGHKFETGGWGYELTICELAVLYAASEREDTDEIMAYADENGTSGNQHDYAKALSRHLTGEPDDEEIVANSVSALSPLTGDLDYSGERA